jgi:FAD/FMN-containing dehydrogenase
VTPQTAEEVSLTLRVLKQLQCQFAVKSGGHAAFEGASNIEGGVTIDLVDLNEISVSDERNVTSLGPGNRWVDVYRKLDGMGLSVVGGRVADIGVGGLILGGGISFFSGRHGWACDNVVNYQV